MALTPRDLRHEKQIEAGTVGRKRGHRFESTLSSAINSMTSKHFVPAVNETHIYNGNPAAELLQYISNDRGIEILDAQASWLGGLATSGLGDALLDEHGNPITKSKSDVLIKLTTDRGIETVGISVKTCNKKTPTNDQMFFTTARAFCLLLSSNGIGVSDEAEKGLSMFCGDAGYRPLDLLSEQELKLRISDPNRYYWEELSERAQGDWKQIIEEHQDQISMLLFQKAYKDDPYPPDYLLHQTVKYLDFDHCETAIFSMDEIVACSHAHCGYVLSTYKVRKGSYRTDIEHLAPRFGFIQFQRGGQRQHPTQLQFNLKAGYFRHINPQTTDQE